MSEIFSTIASAIATAKKLKELSDKARDAEFKNLVADLHLQLAEARTQLADLMQDNTKLKDKIQSLESFQGDPVQAAGNPVGTSRKASGIHCLGRSVAFAELTSVPTAGFLRRSW
jgi:hypothetical protein